MITFDRNGNPQPPGIFPMTLEDFRATFVDSVTGSVTRNNIFISYLIYIEDFKNEIMPTFKQWVNGSYTTMKVDPNDIDVVTIFDVNKPMVSVAPDFSKFTTKGGCKANYDVDGYMIPVFPENDPKYAVTLKWHDYWSKWFGTDRMGNAKALIELSF